MGELSEIGKILDKVYLRAMTEAEAEQAIEELTELARLRGYEKGVTDYMKVADKRFNEAIEQIPDYKRPLGATDDHENGFASGVLLHRAEARKKWQEGK